MFIPLWLQPATYPAMMKTGQEPFLDSRSSDRLSPFANNVLPFALNLRGATYIRK
jgi:hypothetical protein